MKTSKILISLSNQYLIAEMILGQKYYACFCHWAKSVAIIGIFIYIFFIIFFYATDNGNMFKHPGNVSQNPKIVLTKIGNNFKSNYFLFHYLITIDDMSLRIS